MKRVLTITGVYCVCVLIFSLCVVMFHDKVPELLPGASLSYKMQSTLLLFCSFLPAVLISAFVIGYTVMFNKSDKKVLVRFSPTMMWFFKKIALAALCGAAFVTVTYEVFMPLLRQSLNRMEKAPPLYSEYISSAKKYLDTGSYTVAYQYAVAAQNVYPKSEEAQRVKETCEVYFDAMPQSMPSPSFSVPVMVDEPVLPPSNATSYELLLRAMVLYQQKEWLNAHYYSMLALSAAEVGSANEADARMLAAEAWNRLDDVTKFENPEQERLYKRKMEAYRMLMAGDIVDAYYAFGSLMKQHHDDPDVVRYYAVAANEMERQYFFFDEIPQSGILEDARNICFYVPRSNGSFYVVYIKGAAGVQNTGGMVQYLRDVSVYQYTRNGAYEMSFYVPYAKVVAQPVSSFGDDVQVGLGVSGRNASVPLLMLESVDRTERQPVNRPVYDFSGNNVASADSGELSGFLVLPMAYEDFLLLQTVSYDPDDMNLFDLLRFAGKAEKYGYAKEVYGQAVCFRVCRPVLYIAILILAAVVGWNYRLLPKSRFRLHWVLSIPLMTVIVYGVLVLFRYVQRLVNYGLIDLFGMAALPIIAVCSVVALLLASVLFVSRKN